MNEFIIENVMKEVKLLRKGFTSECDLQFITGVAIKNVYPDAKVLMEYSYPPQALLTGDKNRQYIDILVIINNKYYPIELKYKHKSCQNILIFENLKYNLTNQSCITDHRKKYCEDIERLFNLQNIKINNCDFAEGYAILLTNYEQFRNEKSAKQQKYSLDEDNIKKNNGIKEINEKYKNVTYNMKWYTYDEQNKFSYLITTINKK